MSTIEMRAITKRFGPFVANDHVEFILKEGEIHALLGENGAGKTTLMRVLYGLYQADEGEIVINGSPVRIASPNDAIRHGIGMVSQHFTLVPTLTVLENIILGDRQGIFLNENTARQSILAAAKKFEIPVNPDALVQHLSVGEKQRVEILKALYHHARILIMDEPTAVLVPQEVDALMLTLQRLRSEGFSIVFISHKLQEVMAICDRISVLRDGKLISTVEKSDVTQNDLAQMMVGREMNTTAANETSPVQPEILLQISAIQALDTKGLPALKNVSFAVHPGEILGIAGVSGNGQSELAQVLSGMLQPVSGKIIFKGADITRLTPVEIVRLGIGRIPEDRHASVVGEMSVAENIVMETLNNYAPRGLLDRKRINQYAESLIAQYQIKARPQDPIRTLSGGNMQKVLLARTLARNPEVIIVSQPTRGLDVGATEYIHTVLRAQRQRGAGILLISEDLEEVLALSDRIAVIYEGQIMDILETKNTSVEQIGLLMAGTRPDTVTAANQQG
jgi:simple sugar transport system ATP-binding protein